MEDISRELEREIAQSKPKPYKQDRKTRVLIVDDFGKIKSGEYLKKFTWVFGGLSLICLLAAVTFYLLYSSLDKESKQTRSKLDIVEKKLNDLTREKEMLMARLVISGKEPGLDETEAEDKEKSTPAANSDKKTEPVAKPKPPVKPKPEPKKEPEKIVAKLPAATPVPAVEKQPASQIKPELPSSQIEQPPVLTEGINKNVSVEKFTVKKDGTNGNLLVRFDIRNISAEPGDVSGRIFTILKPDTVDEGEWLVVPSSNLENGRPAEIRKGQYFSIAHFKPVKFRIKNHTSPDYYKKASIYIFTTQGKLMVEKLIDITEAE